MNTANTDGNQFSVHITASLQRRVIDEQRDLFRPYKECQKKPSNVTTFHFTIIPSHLMVVPTKSEQCKLTRFSTTLKRKMSQLEIGQKISILVDEQMASLFRVYTVDKDEPLSPGQMLVHVPDGIFGTVTYDQLVSHYKGMFFIKI